jgi:hypothetical protein
VPVLFVGVVITLLFVMEQTHDSRTPTPSQNTASEAVPTGVSDRATIGAPWTNLETFNPIRATLSNDQDHDGKPDSMVDPLAVLLCASVALHPNFVLLAPSVGGILLKLCEQPKLVSSDHCLALERPG